MISVRNADIYTDFSGLAELKNQARQESPEALKAAAKQFESIFLGMVLKSMRQAVLADGIMNSDKTRFYQEMYDQQLSVHLSGDPGIGLADLIVRQLSRDGNAENGTEMTLEDYRLNPFPVAKRMQAVEVNENEPAEKIKLKKSREAPIQSSEQFVNRLWPYAEQAGKKLGIDPKVLLAQAALETGWGGSVIANSHDSSHNLFNIKADGSWPGKRINIAALEFEQGVAVKKTDGFRAYDSYRESFQDYVAFLKSNPRYKNALSQSGDPEKYMRSLQQAGYATDPHYADKVLKIYRGKLLAEFNPDRLTAMR